MRAYIADAFGLDGERICFRFAESMEGAKKMVIEYAEACGLGVSLVDAKEYKTDIDIMEENMYARFHDKVSDSWVGADEDAEEGTE